MTKLTRSILLLFTFLSIAAYSQAPVERVNPFIGSTNYGTTNPGL